MFNDQRNSYARFEKANNPKRVTGIDYVRSIYKTLEIPKDFILKFARLFCPSFLVVDGKVFIADLFEKQKYDELRRTGQSGQSAQFWINLLEITAVFDDLTESQAIEVAESIASSWNKKLRDEFNEALDHARVICDKDSNEIFVVIGYPD